MFTASPFPAASFATIASLATTAFFASAYGVQSPVHERLKGLRNTVDQLEGSSGIDQAAPILVAIAIAALVTAAVYATYDAIMKVVTVRRFVQRAGLTNTEVDWLKSLASKAEVQPWTRVLRSASAFEEITASYLTRELSVSEEWPQEVLRLRDIAQRLDFTSTVAPTRVNTTFDVGSPWPVELQRPGGHTTIHGVVSSDTSDEFVVRAVDELGELRRLLADDEIELSFYPVQGDPPKLFSCRVNRIRSKGPYRTLLLQHSSDFKLQDLEEGLSNASRDATSPEPPVDDAGADPDEEAYLT